jgi:hypothetical protein
MKAAKKPTSRSVTALPLPEGQDVFEGQITAIDDRGVTARIEPTRALKARCPAHVDRNWLAAAVKVAPVDAAFVLPRNGTRPILLAIFPGPEHADVRADVTLVGHRVRIAAEEILIQGKRAHLSLDRKGAVELRGQDVTSRATRLHRIQGGAIRLN